MAFLQTDLIPKIPLDEWTESAVDWITEVGAEWDDRLARLQRRVGERPRL